jgi:two-component system C4-dicarboxylate transport sensor histidine kinase DctB
MALIAAGSTLHLVEQRGIAQETDAARTDMQMRAALITSEIARFRLLPIALADDRDVVAAIKGDGQAREALDRKLESLVRTTGAPNIYVVGTDGRAIAASNWRSPQSFVGSDYSNRRYVRDALVRGDASNFAMGSVSRRPGLYIAQRTEAGGVVVIKLEFDRIEAAWAKGDGVTFVTDADGIVLVSSRSEWRFMLTRPISKAVLAAFGSDAMLPPLSARTVPVDFNKGQAVLDGRDMILVGGKLSQHGWHIALLRPMDATTAFARTAAALAGMLVLGLAAIGWMWHERAIERARRTEELERVVADRTADLRREMSERAASEARAADLREGLRQANRLATLGQVTASVAHETAQPVAAIRTYAETSRVLLDRGDMAAVEKNLATIGRLADRIGLVTSELRGFSRRGARDRAPVAVGAVIEGALLILKEQLKGVHLILPEEDSTALVAGARCSSNRFW